MSFGPPPFAVLLRRQRRSLGRKTSSENAHSADGVLDLISPQVDRYRLWFKQFWLRGDAALASPGPYEFCEVRLITYFIRPSSNSSLKSRILHAPRGAAGRPSEQVYNKLYSIINSITI